MCMHLCVGRECTTHPLLNRCTLCQLLESPGHRRFCACLIKSLLDNIKICVDPTTQQFLLGICLGRALACVHKEMRLGCLSALLVAAKHWGQPTLLLSENDNTWEGVTVMGSVKVSGPQLRMSAQVNSTNIMMNVKNQAAGKCIKYGSISPKLKTCTTRP